MPSSATTPRRDKPKWYKKQQNMSTSTLIGGGAGNTSGASTPVGNQSISAASKRRSKQPDRKTRLEDGIQVTVYIAEIIARQRYIMQSYQTLMKFGAPTHRLEEYMQITAKMLEIDSQYLYLPGCMAMRQPSPLVTGSAANFRLPVGLPLSTLELRDMILWCAVGVVLWAVTGIHSMRLQHCNVLLGVLVKHCKEVSTHSTSQVCNDS